MVSRLCISQWQQAWRIYFLLLWFLLSRCYFAVLYNLCCLSALFLTAALWLLPKPAKLCFFNTNELYTQQNSLTPSTTPSWNQRCALYYWRFCVKTHFFLYFVFLFAICLWSYREKWNRIVVTTLMCLSILYLYFFRIWLPLKIPWFWKAAVFLCCVRGPSTLPVPLPAASFTVQLSWEWARCEPSGRGTHWFWLIRFKDLLIKYEVATPGVTIAHRLDKPLISCSVWLAFCFW